MGHSIPTSRLVQFLANLDFFERFLASGDWKMQENSFEFKKLRMGKGGTFFAHSSSLKPHFTLFLKFGKNIKNLLDKTLQLCFIFYNILHFMYHFSLFGQNLGKQT